MVMAEGRILFLAGDLKKMCAIGQTWRAGTAPATGHLYSALGTTSGKKQYGILKNKNIKRSCVKKKTKMGVYRMYCTLPAYR
jgi:hypothetical protein